MSVIKLYDKCSTPKFGELNPWQLSVSLFLQQYFCRTGTHGFFENSSSSYDHFQYIQDRNQIVAYVE